MNSGAWQPTVHGVTKSWTQLSELKVTMYFTESQNMEGHWI